MNSEQLMRENAILKSENGVIKAENIQLKFENDDLKVQINASKSPYTSPLTEMRHNLKGSQ